MRLATLFQVGLLLFGISQGLDLVTTATLCRIGVGREANPLFQHFNTVGVTIFDVLLKIIAVFFASFFWHRTFNRGTDFERFLVCFSLCFMIGMGVFVVTNAFMILGQCKAFV